MVVGAGMAGLLAANMLRSRLDFICDKASDLPNNHSAVLRFRSSIVGDTLNIPFREVNMIKGYLPWSNPIADHISYSIKTTGKGTIRSSVSSDTKVFKRYIAPPDLIERMANQIDSNKFYWDTNFNTQEWRVPIISTIPMPTLMKVLGYDHKIEFESVSGTNLSVRLPNVDAHVSLYVPDPDYVFSRISLTGDELIVECYTKIDPSDYQETVGTAIELLGITTERDGSFTGEIKATKQRYAKILPVDDRERKKFIHWASEKHNIYSFGRYATWRPGLLLDDLVQDFRIIMKLIDGDSIYDYVK